MNELRPAGGLLGSPELWSRTGHDAGGAFCSCRPMSQAMAALTLEADQAVDVVALMHEEDEAVDAVALTLEEDACCRRDGAAGGRRSYRTNSLIECLLGS